MSLDNLLFKIERMYAAVSTVTEPDLSKFPPTLNVSERAITLHQDFNQGLDRAQLENKAFQMVRSIADMKDHLRAAARSLQRDPDEIEHVINASVPLQLMIDLANYDKHSKHEKPGKQRSKKSPRLENVRGTLQITAKSGEPGSPAFFGIRLTPQGIQSLVQGQSAVVITGEIVDANNVQIMDLESAQASAIEAWESLMVGFGILPK